MNELLISLALIPILGILSQWLAWRLHLPSIIILLFAGFLVGPVFGVLNTDVVFGDLLYPLVSLLVSVIVFEGGLNLRIKDLKNIGRPLLNLVLIAPILTIGFMYLLTHYVLQLPSNVSLMFSALMVITGPTVIIPILRHIKVSPKMSALIRWEGILIAPIGTILIVLVYQSVFISSEPVIEIIAYTLLKTIGVGIILSISVAYIMITFFKRNWVPDFLQELITLMLVLATFICSNAIQPDSGVLTVVLLGIVLANQKMVSLQHIKVFKENLRILSISTLFILLSSRLNFVDLKSLIDIRHGVYLLSLVFIVRPLATYIVLFGKKLNSKEKLLMSWIAPRGIVTASIASLFALRLVNMGVPQAETLVPLTFLVLIFTVVTYGFSLNPFIRFFKLNEEQKVGILVVGASQVSQNICKLIQKIDGIELKVIDSNRRRIQTARLDGLDANNASIFSQKISEEMQLGAYEYLIALTENDEVNTLSCIQYSEILGVDNVYRLPPSSDNVAQGDHLKKIESGVLLTLPAYNYHYLKHVETNNDHLKLVNIISDMDMSEFNSVYGNKTVPLFGISAANKLISGSDQAQFKKVISGLY